MKDIRIPQSRKIIEAIISKTDLMDIEVMITRDNSLVIICKDTLFYLIQLQNLEPGFDICFKYSDIIELEEDEYIQNNYIYNKLYSLYSKYNYYLTSTAPLVVEEVLRENEEFENCLSVKSDDGARFFKLKDINNNLYIIPIFTGFPSLNKPDKIGISVYDLNDGYYLNCMKIFKKKINRDMFILFRTINLN